MASVQVNHEEAKEIILEAYRTVCTKDDAITRGIKAVLSGSHKTYKYILVTGILGKATSEAVNPITLQAGAALSGAYDARSLCHKVLVPFERDFLHNILGGSNEPFLNKPARYTHLSLDNAVRRGRDQQTLALLIELLSSIQSSKDAKQYLACVFSSLREQIESRRKQFETVQPHAPQIVEIYEFCLRFVRQSCEGETAVLVIGTLETLLYRYLNEKFTVRVHKVNQSGASSKEIGDIDVFDEQGYRYSIEVKDKSFNEYDVAHAFAKVLDNHGKQAAFIYGFQAGFDEAAVLAKVKEFEDQGLFALFQDIESYIKNTLFRIPSSSRQAFIDGLLATSQSINCKDTTIQWMRQLFSDLHWLEV